MIKKAVFGGTFDPIHNGHLHVAYEALYKLKLDKVVFMPAGNPPHKVNHKVTDALVRYEMVRRAIEKEEKFEIDDYEIQKNGLSYTFQTIEYITQKEKETEWYFISGMDCLIEIDSWKSIDKILNLCTLAVFNRPGYNIQDMLIQKEKIEKKYNKEIVFLDLPLVELSSSMIRTKIEKCENVSYLLPNEVYKYIFSKNLYT